MQKKPWMLDQETGELLPFNNHDRRIRRMRRRVGGWTRVVAQEWNNRDKNISVMITLTYGGDNSWKVNHVREFMNNVKKFLGSYLIAYAWVAELQQRGAVHYHVMLVQRRGKKIPMPDKSGWWPYGLTRVETAKKPGYLAKYSQKGSEEEDPEFPAGLRLFATVIAKGFTSECMRLIFRSTVLPGWMEKIFIGGGVNADYFPRRKKGGGWIMGGQFYESPWILKMMDARIA